MLNAGGPKNTAQIKPYGVSCVGHVHCLNMLQGHILPRRIGNVLTPVTLRGWLYSCSGHFDKQRLVHVS